MKRIYWTLQLIWWKTRPGGKTVKEAARLYGKASWAAYQLSLTRR